MKPSNLGEVGQMRSSRGTSMKMMMKAHTLEVAVSLGRGMRKDGVAYRHTMLKAMTKVAWKMFAIPSAKQRKIHSTPVLFDGSVCSQPKADG
jgi:hypothetical protein